MAPRWWCPCLAALLAACLPAVGAPSSDPTMGKATQMIFRLENDYARYDFGSDGRNLALVEKRTGQHYARRRPASPFALVRKGGREYPATRISSDRAARGGVCHLPGEVTVEFAGAGAAAVIRAGAERRYFTLEVVSLTGEGVEELVFANLPLTLKGTPQETFAGVALALNLQTNVPDLPRPGGRLWAACYPRFGFAGARVALLACPSSSLRQAMQEAVSAAPELPHSPLGGPWALGQEINQGSYLFNFGNLTLANVGDWTKLAQELGFNQVDFHGGSSFRFGDCQPNPQTYPEGFASLRAVTDRLHGAGIKAGLHTYAFFIDKRCPWVTPVPDPRLAKDATFTLAQPLDEQGAVVPVVESTSAMSTVTGFFVRNSVTLQVDDELIVYTGVAKEPPYAFTGCQRGACGTRPARHAPGARVHHLKECFGLFVPDPETTLLAEVAARTAQAFNQGGFDMIYLDALDGEDILGGAENAWHYGSRFAFEIWRRLERPALMEMSTFHHHLWYVRSRLGAWDHPTRSHKRFIDIHCAANQENLRMFLPGQLGWWAVKTWSGAQGEPTFPDDIEYLCCKALANDTGLSLMGVDPDNVGRLPALPRLVAIFGRYERLRHSGRVPEAVKARLRRPGAEFTLVEGERGRPRFRPVQYDRHKVESPEDWSSRWIARNRFGAQPLRLRIEALYSAGPYDDPASPVIADPGQPGAFPQRGSAPGVQVQLEPSSIQVKVGQASGRLVATSSLAGRWGSWAKAVQVFPTPLDLGERQALGVWVYGDGQGEVLNFQLLCPSHVVAGIGEHYVTVDFTGWRYFTLIEPEGERYADYSWPYGNAYAIYRESIDYRQVASLGLWCNNLPAGGTATCYLSPIKALPLVSATLVNPAVTIGGRTVTFPVRMETGSYLELKSPDDCKLYDPEGKLLAEVRPQGELPVLARGENEVRFTCEAPGGVTPRAYVTLITQGELLPER